jgi:oligopeptide transport system ATP-binding protein
MAPLLQVENVVKDFPVRRGSVLRREHASIRAVDDVSLRVDAGETLALVGESGCGKSTLARVLLGLHPATSGSVRFDDREVVGADTATLRWLRRRVQLIFQDPYASLDPRMTVRSILSEPLEIHGIPVDGRVEQLLEQVGLAPEHAARFPHEFSGGQRQRVGVARAIAVDPDLVICDEPVSALDVSVRAQVLNLLADLQHERGLAYLFISHDLSVVRHVARRVAVMHLGGIVESAANDELFARPLHPYTQSLISAVPVPDPRRERERVRIILRGELPSAAAPPTGCTFHTRCPRFALELDEGDRQRCRDARPTPVERGPDHTVACHFT